MKPAISTWFVLFTITLGAVMATGRVSVSCGGQSTYWPHVTFLSNIGLNDTLRPEISSWGIEGPVTQGLEFSAWANVSDTESGVRNVSLSVHGNTGYQSLYALSFNGSLYWADIPGLAVNASYTLYVIAFDWANNSATSYPRNLDLRPATSTIDPSVSAPIVVSSSLALMGVITVLAIFYDRRRNRQGTQ